MDFVNGLLLGMTLQFSLGPVFFAVLHKAVTAGSREAVKMSLGAAMVDALYIGLSFTGIAFLLQIKILQSVVLAIGAFVLIIFGLSYIRKARAHKNKNKAKTTEALSIDDSEKAIWTNLNGNSFVFGLKLTAINPLTIIFWSGTFGALLTTGVLDSFKEALHYAVGCVSATLIFLGSVSVIAPHIPIRRNQNVETMFDYIVGIVLIIFGVFMLYRFVYLIIK